MKELLLDPRLFNYTIMVLYTVNAGRWLIAKDIGQGMYWLGALWITASVTFLFKH